MTTYMTIGQFARLTHLSVKALRHYHDLGLLEPLVDPANGYRRYEIGQVPAAHLIRRLRQLDMPLTGVKAVLDAPDVDARNRALLMHLRRMEHELQRTHTVVSSLRAMLEHATVALEVERRAVGDVPALAIRARVERSGIAAWCGGAFPELYAAAGAARLVPAGAAGALYFDDYFEDDVGDVVAFVPVPAALPAPVRSQGEPGAAGRVERIVVPAAALAVTVHAGDYGDIDRTYGALGSRVAAQGVAAGGPIREHYLVGPGVTDDVARFRTEVCWPISEGAL